MTIKKGDVVGFIGPSGSGKTTIINILLRFLKPSSGLFSVDNNPISNFSLSSFYQKVGYVQQHVYLVDSTLAENIAFGLDINQIDFNKIHEVIKKVGLLKMVNLLPNGLNTLIGENGSKLSGGQRQRIGIARALYFDADILF